MHKVVGKVWMRLMALADDYAEKNPIKKSSVIQTLVV